MPLATVLIVGSDPQELATMQGALQEEGFLVRLARNGDEALGALSAQDIQIILLSATLAGNSALELSRAVRKASRELPLQLVLVSKVRDAADLRLSIEAGADDFIRAPLDAHELKARTRAACMRWQNQATLVKEREFYRVAVAEEERLSSLVLDQNQNLKDAYEKIRRLNEELAKANKELELIAAYDSLSGLLNRRSLFTRIEIEIERGMRLDVPLSGLMIDIDHFKDINDNHGHQCGDTVIRQIGERLNAGLRKYDYAGRYGGEEFFVVLSNSSLSQAASIGERFRREMEELRMTCAAESFGVTVSIGAACYQSGESQESWIERVDRAMYQAKQAGRNRILSS
jgi:diguanylate cyclase (GGDEF)-like protein